MIIRKHIIEDCNYCVECTFVYESIKLKTARNMPIKDVEDAQQITFRYRPFVRTFNYLKMAKITVDS